MSDRPSRRTLLGCLFLALTGCGLTRDPEIADAVAAVRTQRLMGDLAALTALGPRPADDGPATDAAVAWLEARLAEAGWSVEREPVPFTRDDRSLRARVRAVGADETSPLEEVELSSAFARYGDRPMRGQSERLRAEGWQVESYVLDLSGAGRLGQHATTVPNLLVTIPGTGGFGGLLEVSAHYDSVPGSPGAADNGGGVVALLELARVLADHPPARDVRLCFFAAEEAGLLGSEEHVARFAERGDDVVGLINLDDVGWASEAPGSQDAPIRIPLIASLPTTADFVLVLGNWGSGSLGALYEDAIDTYVPELPYYSANRIGGFFGDARRSDHAPYWDAGVPAIFITDTGEFRSEHYHMPGDVVERIDSDFLTAVTRATVAAVLERARR